MNCPDCGFEVLQPPCTCGWGEATLTPTGAAAKAMVLYRGVYGGISKEEFGLRLYETIQTIGGLLGLDEQRAVAVHRGVGGRVLAGLARRRRVLQATLAKQLPLLQGDELDQVLARYPWVVTQ